MECSQVEIALMDGSVNNEVAEHLEKCAECQIFKDSLDSFLPAKPVQTLTSPSDKIDTAIREVADLFLEEQMKSLNHHQPKYIHRPQKIISYLASAACGVLIAWLVVLALESTQTRRLGDGNSQPMLIESSNSNELLWSNGTMDDDLLDIATDIEVSIVLLPNEEESLSKDQE